MLSLLLITVYNISAQVSDSILNVYADQVPFQKVHVHFDKDLYRAGETIWFKTYLFSGFSPSSQGKNFYAELISNEGKVLQRKVYPITESITAGNFDLPDSMQAQNVVFRGYTTWMLNFDTAYLYTKTIPVTDNTGAGLKQQVKKQNLTLLQFFPESGNLVNTLSSVVAFKANDEAGLPVDVKGTIVNSKNETVTTFASLHNGMGTFELTPLPGESYKAVWTDANGKQQTTALPEAKTSGYVYAVTEVTDRIAFTIKRTDEVPEDWKSIHIIGLLGQERVYRATVNLTESKVTSGSVPVGQLPSGLVVFTIFSSGWEPIAERIVMVNNNNYTFDATVNTPVLNSQFRAKNVIEVSIDDTLLSNLSISVTDAALGKQKYEENIISRMLLTGEIKGYVHNPGYYFSNNSDSTARHLDLVMLTHGWRRYNWNLVARGRKPTIKYPLDSYLTLDARVFGVTTASPLRSDEELIAIINTKDSLQQIVQLPKTGVDKFSAPVIFFDTATVYYQFAKDKKAERDMALAFGNNLYKGVPSVNVMNRPFTLQVDSAALARTKFLGEKLVQNSSRFDNAVVLQSVTVKGRTRSRMQEMDERYTSGLFSGGDGYSFDLTNDNNVFAYDVFTYLQGKVAGLQIAGVGSSATLSWRGSSTALYLNEMPADAQMVSSIPVTDIAYIKVFRPPFLGGSMMSGGAGGAIAIYTKRGGEGQSRVEGKGLNKSLVAGYSAPKEFYSPNYGDLASSATVTADYRSTLYWAPIVLLNGSRKSMRLEFYNNDITKSFRIVMEGINEIGKMVRIEKVVEQ